MSTILLKNSTLVALAGILWTGALNAQHKAPEHILKPGTWKFAGHVGERIDRIAEKRLLDIESWKRIYPETEAAFRLREDDVDYPKRGVWRGEFWGKYVLSAIDAYRYYQSEELKGRIRTAVDGLLATQEDNGYIGTYAHSGFVLGNNWNIWSRKYTLWGLLEAWELLGDPNILSAAEKFTAHLISQAGPDAVDIVRTGNYHGLPSSSILQPIVMLYRATGQKKYLDYAEYIVEQWSRQPDGLPDILGKGSSSVPVDQWFPEKDPYKWAKGYEFLSCVEGLIELYQVTSEVRYLRTAENIHELVLQGERSPIGTLGFNDKFIGSSKLINTVAEICDAVYWNRLSFALFKVTGKEKYISEIERTFYNSLLCAYNPEGSWGLRRLRMSHQHVPSTNHFLQHHQCCMDNLPRGLFQASEAVLAARGDKIYWSLFNPGAGSVKLGDSGEEIGITIAGDYLDGSLVKATLQLSGSGKNTVKQKRFKLLLRMPAWSRETRVKINGRMQKAGVQHNWMTIERTWKDGDEIVIDFDLGLRWEYFNVSSDLPDDQEITYNKRWAGMKYVKGSNSEINALYLDMPVLSAADALPNKPAVTFFYGPLALARDVRVSGQDIFSAISPPSAAASPSIKRIAAPAGIWKAFEVKLNNQEVLRFCNFSSAGNTWDEASTFNTWCLIE